MLHHEKMLDPIAGTPATGKTVVGIIHLSVDDLFGTGGTEMEQRVLSRLGKDFQVGSVTCTGQRIRWIKDSQSGRDPSRTKHERRSPQFSCDAYKVQEPSGTDELVAE